VIANVSLLALELRRHAETKGPVTVEYREL
jgi:hypothetical protein